jgi:hypothetical protein
MRAKEHMKSDEFWSFYESVRPILNLRADSFARMFEYLDGFERPVGIVETGCTREPGNWRGDGQSSVLFDKYAQTHMGSLVLSVDIDPKATEVCRSLVSQHVRVHTGDSIKFLQALADNPLPEMPFVDLLYLDSYDLNWEDSTPSALHHVKELVAGAPFIRRHTLVAVDDCYVVTAGVSMPNGSLMPLRQPKIDGKGRFVADYAQHIGAEKVFEGYQCGWTKMRAVD